MDSAARPPRRVGEKSRKSVSGKGQPPAGTSVQRSAGLEDSAAGKQVAHGVLHCANAMTPKRLRGTRCLKCRQGIVQAAGSVVTPEAHSAPLCD